MLKETQKEKVTKPRQQRTQELTELSCLAP